MPPPTRNTLLLGSYPGHIPSDTPVCTDPSLTPAIDSHPAPQPGALSSSIQPASTPTSENGTAALENSASLFGERALAAASPSQPASFDYAAHGLSETAYRSMLADTGLTDERFSALAPGQRRTILAGNNGQLLFRSHPRFLAAGAEERLRLMSEFYRESYHAPEDASGVKLQSGHTIWEGQARAYWKAYGELPPLAAHQDLKPWSQTAQYNPAAEPTPSSNTIPEGLADVEPQRAQPHPRMAAAFDRWLSSTKPPKHIAEAASERFAEACERAPQHAAESIRLTDGTQVPKAHLEALTESQNFVRTETRRFYLAAYAGQRLIEDVELAKVHAMEKAARGMSYASRSQVSQKSAQIVEASIGGKNDFNIVRLADGREILAVQHRLLREAYGIELPEHHAANAKASTSTAPANESALVPDWVAKQGRSQQGPFKSAVLSSLEALHKNPAFTEKPFARQMEMQAILLNDLRADSRWTHFNNLESRADGSSHIKNVEALVSSAIEREAMLHRLHQNTAVSPQPKPAPTEPAPKKTAPVERVDWTHREAASVRHEIDLKLGTIKELSSYKPSDRHILATRYANEWRTAFTPEQRAALIRNSRDNVSATGFTLPPRLALRLMLVRDALVVGCGLKPQRAMQLINAHRDFFMQKVPKAWLEMPGEQRHAYEGGYLEFVANRVETELKTDPELKRSVKVFRRTMHRQEELAWKRENATRVRRGSDPLSEVSKPHRPGRLNVVRLAAYQRDPENWGSAKEQGGILSIFASLPRRLRSGASTKSSVNPPAPDTETEKPHKLHSAGPEALLIAIYGEHAFKPRAGASDHVITISNKDMKAFEALAEAHGISSERVPELLAGRAGIEAQKKVAATIEAKLTPENVAIWLETPRGQEWIAANRDALADTFRNRWKAGAPGLAMAVVGLLGAREVGEIVGIDPVKQPVEHFILSAYTVHACNETGRAAGEVLMRRSARLPMDFVKTEIVGTGKATALRMTLSSRTTLARAFFGALTKNFAGKSTLAIAGNVITLPIRQLPGMGSSIACSRITDLVLQKIFPNMDPSTRAYITEGALIAPIAYRIAAGTRAGKSIAAALARTRLGAKLAESAVVRSLLGSGALSGMRIAGRVVAKVFSSGFALDMTTLAAHLVFTGWDEGAYRRSVNDRVQTRLHEEEDEILANADLGASLFYGATTSATKAMEFFSPVFSAEIERRLAGSDGILSINTTGRDFELEIYAEDLNQSEIIREELPEQILLAMTAGVGDEMDTASFYRTFEGDGLDEEIELSDDEEVLLGDIRKIYARMSTEGAAPAEIMAARNELIAKRVPAENLAAFERRIGAWELQESLRTLHFLYISENEDIRAMADDDGVVTDRDALLALAMPKLTPEARREKILDMRKTSLIARILEAERSQSPEHEKLLALAKEVGLTDAQGNLATDERYDQALAIVIARSTRRA